MIVALLVLAAAALLAVEVARKFRRLQSPIVTGRLPLPPGPTPLPFVGNIFDINKDVPHLSHTEFSKMYGDIIYTHVLGQGSIVLNSEDVATALLDKRSQKYSDRPVFRIAKLFNWEWPTTNARYGPRFRLHRRLLHQVFHAQAALSYRPRQMQRAYEMVMNLLQDPMHYEAHFTTFTAAVVMEITYGYDLKGGETFVTTMQHAADIVLRNATFEALALCDMLPWAVKLLPAWFPKMGFKLEAAECRSLAVEAVNAPYEWVKRRLEEGNAAPSMVADAIREHHLDGDSKDLELVQGVKDSAATLYAAAVETTNAILVIFVYLMMNHPEIQCRAQAEIGRVVGRQRLPEFEDRPLLPYIDALMRETMRWHPVLPLGLPHATTEDDIYEGYFIPRETMIIFNLWAMSRNEEKYPNPEAFMPERFLREDGTLTEDKVTWMFGFGRRICPGRHFAEVSLWSAMVCILALFTIEKTDGSDNVKWTTGFSSHPLPFPCKFVPREEEMDAQKLASLMYTHRVEM